MGVVQTASQLLELTNWRMRDAVQRCREIEFSSSTLSSPLYTSTRCMPRRRQVRRLACRQRQLHHQTFTEEAHEPPRMRASSCRRVFSLAEQLSADSASAGRVLETVEGAKTSAALTKIN